MNDVEAFLEHFGKKGMKWGQRRQQGTQRHLDRLSRVASGTATKQDKANIRARRIGTASLVGAGVITTGLLARHGTVSLKQANSMSNAKAAKALLDVHKSVKMHAVNAQLANQVKTGAAKLLLNG